MSIETWKSSSDNLDIALVTLFINILQTLISDIQEVASKCVILDE